MPIIDLGVNFDDVKEMDEFPVVPTGTYPFVVKAADLTKTGPNSKNPGRPMIKWTITVNQPDTGAPVNIFYNTPLPVMVNNELNVDGMGLLVSICKAVGLPWTGGSVNTDGMIGRGGTVEVRQKAKQIKDGDKYIDDPSGAKTNEVAKFVY